jgi:hypothetical protein
MSDRSYDEQASFDTFSGFALRLRALGAERRQDALDAMLVAFHDEPLARGQLAPSLADKVLCLLDVAPMSPLEMGRILGVDSEAAIFKNALTSLRHAGLVVTSGTKKCRMYRRT